MNDFTKEELQYMNAGVKCIYTFHAFGGEKETLNNLMAKIKSMINNYCEHEPEGDWHVAVDKCKKCGVICDDNQ